MAQATQPYKRSLAGSVGAGMKSVFGAEGRRYYILEHKVSTKYHKVGESQKIIVDQIELGRDPKCQVRFDESFGTVSRRHAAIIKDGDNWKLIQLSQTNSTYLNGRKVEKEWYLQSGDEIQLSTNGPKLGFIVPQGNKGLVSSIGMTARLNLFRQQALRPYKQALTALACILVFCVLGGGYVIWEQQSQIELNRIENERIKDDLREKMAEAERQRRNDSINNVNESRRQQEEFARQINQERRRTDAVIAEANRRAAVMGSSSVGISAMLEQQNIFKDIFFLVTEKVVYVENGIEHVIMNGNQKYGWGGTGFLLNDGRFVTARHCIEGWLYQDPAGNNMSEVAARVAATNSEIKMKAYFMAISTRSHTQFQFCSTDFKINHSMDKTMQVGVDDNGNPVNWCFPYPANADWPQTMWTTDWAYTTKTQGKKGNIEADVQLCKNLLPMQKLVVLGFPQGLGVGDGDEMVDPISNELTTSRSGLANNGCILHSRGTDHGNSGGPIFAIKDDKLVVVGIVSRGDMRTSEHNWAVPICNIY